MRLFKDALAKYSAEKPWSFLSNEDETVAELAAAKVEDAYAKVREPAPEELDGNDAPTYAEILTTLRKEGKEREEMLPSRRVLVHVLANLDYYFFKLTTGYERGYDMPNLTDEERAAEHGLRHDLLLKLYEELEPAFDVSLSWPPDGYEVSEEGKLVEVEAEFAGMAAVGYDCGYDMEIFYEGHADDEVYLRGFVSSVVRCSRRMARRNLFMHWGAFWNPAMSFRCSKRKCRAKASALRAAISSLDGLTVHLTSG